FGGVGFYCNLAAVELFLGPLVSGYFVEGLGVAGFGAQTFGDKLKTVGGVIAGTLGKIAALAAALAVLDQVFNDGAGNRQVFGDQIGGAINDLLAVLNTGAPILAAVTGNAEQLNDIIASWVRV
ncbi:hypothetical protein Q8G47_28040, partial [Klebsiella pneumoniae]|uniref:hypothetical protein n=1 Tax=Klebsiella pneumoniae TaxID=573 RepID=UPI0030135A82